MIQLSELTKSFGDRVLLDHVTWQITARERVGLCGPNGAGKTTLLRMMAGLEEADSGAILKPAALTVGYLPQDGLTHAGRTVFDEASSAFDALARDEGRDARARGAAGRPGDSRTRARRDARALQRPPGSLPAGRRLQHRAAGPAPCFRVSASGRATSSGSTETFSGGWQMRIALAKLLLGQPNLLLLDEPTNHLDLEARNWLEGYLNDYPHAVILVSHDRFFLDAVVTRIADLTLRTLTDYVGNYSQYLVAHEARIEAAAQGEARAGRGSGARQDVHRPVPLPGDQGVAGAEPDQDAREGRADRGAARAEEDPLRLSRPPARAAGRCSS